MKERISITVDNNTLKLIEELFESGGFRNKSHLVEEAINQLKDEIEMENIGSEKGVNIR